MPTKRDTRPLHEIIADARARSAKPAAPAPRALRPLVARSPGTVVAALRGATTRAQAETVVGRLSLREIAEVRDFDGLSRDHGRKADQAARLVDHYYQARADSDAILAGGRGGRGTRKKAAAMAPTSFSRPTDPAPARTADLERQVSAAYRKLATRPGGWVELTTLRETLPRMSRTDLDATLVAMLERPGVALEPEPFGYRVDARTRKAALHIGGEARHKLSLPTPPETVHPRPGAVQAEQPALPGMPARSDFHSMLHELRAGEKSAAALARRLDVPVSTLAYWLKTPTARPRDKALVARVLGT